MATRRVDLAPYFALNRYGRYQLNANVHIKEWDSTLSAKPRSFDLIKGAKLWSQEFGMFLPPGVTNRVPEVRRYSLEQANYLRTQLRLYVRITDVDDTHVIKVLAVGPMVSVSHPERQIDRRQQSARALPGRRPDLSLCRDHSGWRNDPAADARNHHDPPALAGG
jgi:hypothetical protein